MHYICNACVTTVTHTAAVRTLLLKIASLFGHPRLQFRVRLRPRAFADVRNTKTLRTHPPRWRTHPQSAHLWSFITPGPDNPYTCNTIRFWLMGCKPNNFTNPDEILHAVADLRCLLPCQISS